jgi:formylglycine-generating enzyme required for sulfatase activity
MTRVYISYRRDDSGGYAPLLFDRLAKVFGRHQIFMDVEPDLIAETVEACDVLFVLIGRKWLTLTDDSGQPCIDAPQDSVRLELMTAIDHNLRMAPVLVRNARMPTAEVLPAALQPLAHLQPITLDDDYLTRDLQHVIDVLEQLLIYTPAQIVSAGPSTDDLVMNLTTRDSLPSKLSIPRATYLLFEPVTVQIPAGAFLQGDNNQRVTLPEYWIGKHPVKVGEFHAFVQEGGYSERQFWTAAGWAWREALNRTQPDDWVASPWTGDDALPVIGVSWYEAYAFCSWLAARTHLPYRLPTSLEWEKAARGTDGRVYPWGNDRLKVKCNIYGSGMGQTSRVGLYSPQSDSPYGVTDLVDNVSEWCLTRWDDDPFAPPDNNADGDGPRIRHGGSWASANLVRPSMRIWGVPDFTSNYVGFRVARSPLE